MEALVVVESIFGNTRKVAEAFIAGLSRRLSVQIVDVADAPAAIGDDVRLLVVGAPTHAFGMTRSSTRQSAAQAAGGAGVVVADTGLREWLDALPHVDGRLAAAFDTRINRPRLPGSAARAAARRLQRMGYCVITKPRSFRVQGTRGPLVDGEFDRARAWGAELGALLVDLMPATPDRD